MLVDENPLYDNLYFFHCEILLGKAEKPSNNLLSVKVGDVALKQGYIIGGSKTDAGLNRKIPILPCIQPYIEAWMHTDGKIVSLDERAGRYLITNGAGKRLDLKNFRSRQFYPLLVEL